MKIIVAIKHVVSRDSVLEIRHDGRWIDEEDLSFEMNEPDAYALEAALQLKEQHGGEVIALCAGPADASKTIREALAKGADRALHIEAESLEQAGSLSLGRLLAAAVEPEAPDLVLTGLQSDDLGSGQTGVVLAELLGLPHASIIVEIERTETGIRARRELEGGWFQRIELPLPAVLTIQSGISKLRYATLMGIRQARGKEVRRLTAGDLGVSLDQPAALSRVYPPERTKQTQILGGSPAEAAAQLVEKLKREARAI